MKKRLIPLIVASLLIAAHFLRSADYLLVVVCLSAPFLLLLKKRWSLYLLQIFMLVSSVIWLQTLWEIIQVRLLEGRSWLPSGIILGTVTALTLWAGWLLNTPKVIDRYPK